MSRLVRAVVPGLPHHLTQRGNRRQSVFFSPEDRRTYLQLLRTQAERFGVEIWAYCLMDNHVHHVAVPKTPESLARAFGEAHRRYSRLINFREGWRGHLWQDRFYSVVLDSPHLYAALRYVERNPVRAGLAKTADTYPWSSAAAHVARTPDRLLSAHFVQEEIRDWAAFLAPEQPEAELHRFRRHTVTGRPMGDDAFLKRCEDLIHRDLHPRRPGPKGPRAKR